MTALLLFSVLTSGLESAEYLAVAERDVIRPLYLHLGNDRQSDVIRSELNRDQPWFNIQRKAITKRHRLIVDDDARLFPTWRFNRNLPKERFKPGSFSASGTFMLSLRSIAEIDRWENAYDVGGSRLVIEGGELRFLTQFDRLAFPPDFSAEENEIRVRIILRDASRKR